MSLHFYTFGKNSMSYSDFFGIPILCNCYTLLFFCSLSYIEYALIYSDACSGLTKRIYYYKGKETTVSEGFFIKLDDRFFIFLDQPDIYV